MVLNLFRNENISIFIIGWEINLSNSTTNVNLPPISVKMKFWKIQTYKLYTWSFPTASFVPTPPFSWKYKPSLPSLFNIPLVPTCVTDHKLCRRRAFFHPRSAPSSLSTLEKNMLYLGPWKNIKKTRGINKNCSLLSAHGKVSRRLEASLKIAVAVRPLN